MTHPNPQLEAIVADVLATPKYASISPALVQAVAARELRAHPRSKEALKETKSKLHQIAASYIGADFQRAIALDMLHAAFAETVGVPDSWQLPAAHEACLAIMGMHASTRERLPYLERFYDTILGGLPPVTSVLDLACGLNPLAFGWMPLAPHAAYYACDAVGSLVAVVGEFLALAGIKGQASTCDLLSNPPDRPVDLALALKLLPVLEQVERNAGARLLRELNARWIVVSYPTRSLGGRGRGMAANYERQFRDAIAEQPWRATPFEFPNELVFLIDKGRQPPV
ncbi:MAG TPA: 16S rRNA methyltransferase [Roseiflexaceae bacterium]|nr:16S rRNA methyltransferase [Roseiflexaceae bacterium]